MFRLFILIAFSFTLFSGSLAAAVPPHQTPEVKVTEEDEDTGGKIKLPRSPNSVFYVHIDPLVLPVIGNKGVTEVVSLLVKLQVDDQRTVERVNSISPKLNDAYLRSLYGLIDRSVYRNGRFLDVTKIKNRLTKVTETMIGKDIVRDVLIQGVNQRQYN